MRVQFGFILFSWCGAVFVYLVRSNNLLKDQRADLFFFGKKESNRRIEDKVRKLKSFEAALNIKTKIASLFKWFGSSLVIIFISIANILFRRGEEQDFPRLITRLLFLKKKQQIFRFAIDWVAAKPGFSQSIGVCRSSVYLGMEKIDKSWIKWAETKWADQILV